MGIGRLFAMIGFVLDGKARWGQEPYLLAAVENA